MAASDGLDVFREFIGKKVVGVLPHIEPVCRGYSRGTQTLVFDDGTGLTVAAGSFWADSVRDTKSAISKRNKQLEQSRRDLAAVPND